MMPSGFQQNLNQINPNYYRVSLNIADSTADVVLTNRGGVTPTSTDSFGIADYPTTLAKSQERAQGNIRFKNIIQQLSNLADIRIIDVTITEANGDAQANGASALVFTVVADRDAFILLNWNAYQKSIGDTANGTFIFNDVTYIAYNGSDGATPITTIPLAIKDCIARAWALTYTQAYRVYNPVVEFDSQQPITVTAPEAVGTLFGKTTVTQIDGTTLV